MNQSKMGRPPKKEEEKLVRVTTFLPQKLKGKLDRDLQTYKATNMSSLIAMIIAEHYNDF